MATHSLFLGGNRNQFVNPPRMFPQTDVKPDQVFEADNRRGPIDFSLTRELVWKCHEAINKGCPDDAFSDALAQYVECLEAPFADGDIIETNIMPRHSSLREVWVNVVKPAAGLTADIVVRGNAASLGGTPAVPAPVTVAAGVDLGTEGSQLITLANPLYFDQNDMLQLVLTGVDHDELICSQIMVSPVVREYCRGRY